MTVMKDTAGAALIAKEMEADCMKLSVKSTVKLPMMNTKPYIYSLREAKVVVLTPLQNKEISRISRCTDNLKMGLNVGQSISGKKVLLCSDTAISEIRVGEPKAVSGRHKRQYTKVKAKERCIAFVITTWHQEDIEPPEPMKYLFILYEL